MKKGKVLFLSVFFLGLGILLAYITSNIYVGKDKIEINAQELVEIEEVKEEEVIEKFTSLDILAVGDVMYHNTQVKASNYNGTYDFKSNYKYVKPYIEQADIAIGNFETVTAAGDLAYSGYPCFNSPVETVQALKDAGFDIFSTINNHSLDQGKQGLLGTLESMEENGIETVGTYASKKSRVILREDKEIKTGYLAYSYGFNGNEVRLSEEERSFMINTIDRDKILEDIKELKEREADVIIAFMHWGNEYQREASSEQRELAKFMIEAGVDIILGSHPHVIQESEVLEFEGKKKLIVYSMGNFISNQRLDTMGNSFTEDGVMVKLKIEKDHVKNTSEIKSVDFIPTWVHKYWKDNRNNYEILPAKDVIEGNLELDLKDSVRERIRKSYEDTINKIASSI